MGPFRLLSRFVRLTICGVVLAAATRTLCAAEVRIPGVVDSTKIVALSGGVSPRVAVAKDLGAVSGDRRLESMTLRFSMTAAQQKALTALIAAQQNPASGTYHQWLTPEQYAAQFGLAASDLAKVTGWLTAQGFTVKETARGASFVRFSGTVAQAQSAFKTQIHTLELNDEIYVANVTAPSLPASIAAVTLGVSGLDDFRWKAQHTARPQFTSGSTHYISPADFYTIYDENALLSSKVTGTGVTIAVVGQTDIYPADIAAFQAAAGLTNVAVTQNLYGVDPGYPSANDLTEAELDLEWAGAIAPGANLVFVNSFDVIDGSLTEAIDNDVAPIIAVSYGSCEADLGATPLAFYEQILQQGAAEGISVAGSAGDSGATDCDVAVSSAVDGLAVNFPASSPLVTGVGGTELNEGSGTYWSATNGATGGSALSYIPEVVWNDDTGTGLDAGGGGASLVYPKPSWQVGTGVPADFSRDVPDVALSASITHDGYLICTNVATAGNCATGFASAAGSEEIAGGTSFGAPIFAGLVALVEQQTGGKPMGAVNPVIYALANSTYAGSVFNDITSGTNASPCTMGSVGCPNGGTIGYTANHGYDQASGWGSVNAYTMVNDWALVTPLATTPAGTTPSATYLSGSATSVTSGGSVMFTITVAAAGGASGTPTGSVQLTVDDVAVGSALALTSGGATYTLSTATLSAGSHTVQATYNGDASFAGSKGAFGISVIPAGTPDFALTPSTATITVKSGAIASPMAFTVSALNGFTGAVTFYGSTSATTTPPYQIAFTVNPVTLTSTVTSGSTNLSLLAYTQNSKNEMPGWYRAGGGVVLAGMVLLVLPRRRKLAGLLGVMLAAGAMGMVGCTSPATPTTATATTTPTPTGTYTILVSASATINGTVTAHYSTVTLVVQ